MFLFVLAIGAFITVVFATGALDRGIGRLAHRLRDRGPLLIVGVMALFSLLGTVEGFAEETLGFYGLIVPLMLALGFDRLVATGTIILGAGVGVLCSTVNPFATGVASSAADISLGDGIALRFVDVGGADARSPSRTSSATRAGCAPTPAAPCAASCPGTASRRGRRRGPRSRRS